MKNIKKGISLISLIITIAVIIILAAVTIQNGMQRTDNAKFAEHNTNISTTQEEVENYYNYKDAELPILNLTPYPIPADSRLLAEITQNGEQSDTFYILDLSKIGRVSGKEGTGVGDDIYIVSTTRHNVYYVKGTVIKGITYHGLISKNDIKLAQVTSPTSGNTYSNPVVPTGFTHVGSGTWENGFIIEDSAENQFVWVPALASEIHADGTLDNTTFNSKFGRRNFRGETFDSSRFYETNDSVLQNMITSVNKYGGFYIARYEASNNGSDVVQSKADKIPWAGVNWNIAKEKAEEMDTKQGWNTSVESYLCYGAHWDTTLEWLIDSGAKAVEDVQTDSENWGNYANTTFTYGAGLTKILGAYTQVNTGVTTIPANRHCVKDIYDLAGNASEWTMERYSTSYRVLRGGHRANDSGDSPTASRGAMAAAAANSDCGFRVVLYVY